MLKVRSTMKLNGWERLGVVVSVIWLLAVIAVACLERWGDTPFQRFYFVEFSPDNTQQPTTEVEPTTGQTFTLKPVKVNISVASILQTALPPLLIFWPLVYTIIWVARWIKRGFSDN